jgi:hypothetical protein
MWVFCLRSLVREYGWRFIARVGAAHPWRSLRAFHEVAALDTAHGSLDLGAVRSGRPRRGPLSVVGAGFCLKPLDPPCPSGRFNHDCVHLERLAGAWAEAAPAPCGRCAIRDLGARALGAGAAFYVMTSARDILDDIFVPAMRRRAFAAGLFVICRYSFGPFAFGLLASGMSGRLLPLERGDCRDYRTWLLADRGIKDEQTTLGAEVLGDAARLLPTTAHPHAICVERRGNLLYSVGQQSFV